MNAVVETKSTASLVTKMGAKFGVAADKLLNTLKATAFKTADGVTNEQMMALLVVSDQYGLNPFTREIYAFPDKRGGIVPVVGVDGWSRIINQNASFDGMEFIDHEDAMECVMYRKDRNHPTKVREYLSECIRGTDPWRTHPKRMLRHKAMIQCARLAFGYVGIFDEDEAQRIVEGDVRVVDQEIANLNDKIKDRVQPANIADATFNAAAPQFTLEELTEELKPLTDSDFDAASLVFDKARTLPEEDIAKLKAIWEAKQPQPA